MKQLMRKWLSYPFVYAVKGILKLILWTCRVEVTGLKQLVETASKNPTILMLWHNRLILLPELLYQNAGQFTYCALISRSRDGELVSILAHSYANGRTLRVAHHARHQALTSMILRLKTQNDVMVITPDGPRGPKYKVKPGIVVAAQEAKASIIPVSWTADRLWRLNSWDRMQIPKPFSRIQVVFGEPLIITGSEQLETSTEMLANTLHDLDTK